MAFDIFIAALLPWLVLLGMAIAAALLALFILSFRSPQSIAPTHQFIRSYGAILAGVVALTATIGSLFYSQVLGFTPCPLCWYQRVLMYPLVILFGVAALLKARDVYKYALSLAVPGFVVAVYHYIVQVYQLTTACVAPGGRELEAAQCTMRFVFDFGFVSIPFMAAVAFLMIILISLLALRKPRTGR